MLPTIVDPRGYTYRQTKPQNSPIRWICNTTSICTGSILSVGTTYKTSNPHMEICKPNPLVVETLKFNAYAESILSDAFSRKRTADVYNECSQKFQRAAAAKSYQSVRRNFNRFKYVDKLPKTIDQLDLNLQDPEYEIPDFNVILEIWFTYFLLIAVITNMEGVPFTILT